MKRRDRQPEQPDLLFDPPLRHPSQRASEGSPEAEAESASALGDQSLRGQSLPLFPERELESDSVDEVGAAEMALEAGPLEDRPLEDGSFEDRATPRPEACPPSMASAFSRLFAGVVDLIVHGAVLLLVLVGELALGVPPTWAQWPAFAVFLLAFSFPYTAIALAFWGQTPGMSVAGFEVRTAERENLTLPQTAVRWFAAILSYSLLGLPLLLAITGRSLGDRLSRSEARYLDP